VDDATGDILATRVSVEETAERVMLSHVDADGDFEVRTASAGAPAATVRSVSRSELPLALTSDEAMETVERWVAETRVARDRLRFALSPGGKQVGAGDIVRLGEAGTFRIDMIEETSVRSVEASRIEAGIYRPAEYPASPARVELAYPPLPVEAVFLDLPLLTGTEDPVAPYVAVSADPWATTAVFSSSDGDTYALEAVVDRGAVLGETETDLAASQPGVWDRGAPLRLRLDGGALSSATELAVLNGANAMAIGNGTDDWEVFQFADAELLEPDLWAVSRLLRGQAGTDALMPPVWPAGSRVVLLDDGPVQFALPQAMIGVSRLYRYGPARRPPDDKAYRNAVATFRGVGLRPFAPVRLKAVRQTDGIAFSWIRRTRLDGDRWDGLDVPLGETTERYALRIVADGVVRREAEVTVPFWSYGDALRAGDGVTGAFVLEVAQISDRFGPGLRARISIDG
jgi:hypothetical protein